MSDCRLNHADGTPGASTTRRKLLAVLAGAAAVAVPRGDGVTADRDDGRRAAAAPASPAPEPVPQGVRRLADAVIRGTTRRLVDRDSGEFIVDSTTIGPRPGITIESGFNAWFSQNWLLAEGMRRLAVALDEPRYRDYGEENLDFIHRHLPFFTRQHEAGMQAHPLGDGRLSPIGYYFAPSAPWHLGLAPLLAERHAATGDRTYEPFLGRAERLLATSPRLDDGTILRAGKGLLADDVVMTVPFLLRRWRASGDEAWLDAAVAQVRGAHRLLFDAERELFRHGWDIRTGRPAGGFFGRANGWLAAAQIELLAALPDGHPHRDTLRVAFRRHMNGVDRAAAVAGGWHQLLDRPDTWMETSCTGLLTAALARGVNEGWLDGGLAATARQGWKGVAAHILPDGDLIDTCGSIDTGTVDHYRTRPRRRGDLHGFGPVLLAGAEILRLDARQTVARDPAARTG